MNVSEYFKKYVKGKRVAFVGLAPNILGKRLGKEIDSFDVIIRSNEYPILDKWQEDYGKKCDLIALHVKNTNRNYTGVKGILHYENVKSKSPDIDYLLITKDDRLRVRDVIVQKIGEDPIFGTQGINIMQFCIEGGAKEFKFFGITGYQNKNGQIMECHEVQHDIHRKKTNRTKYTMRDHPTHNFNVLNNYLRYLLEKGKITMDQYSYEYFKQ